MPRTRQPIDPEKKARILQAAMHEFAHHGYRDAKTDAIANAADVSKGLIFHYFGSKANLYLETIQTTFDKIMAAADLSVWQDAPDFRTMVARALRYKIQLQLQYPDEFTLSMAAYAELGSLPETLRPKVRAIWQKLMATSVPTITSPVVGRLKLRAGVSAEQVQGMVMMVLNAIAEQSKAMISTNPALSIEAFDPIVQQAMGYMDILEHGFLAE
ncbi:TetR/AcrR family transcriptional regulator [Lacticaseibacillus daqingensis]|uniref:TetR/AcrR family transcriptional regulator n=1 Tax=Lacticaseibacillus daqingensis TaxID=2486014 RepID=UPI000F7A6D7D|nr:TetR/AcrR family transcriptional regulator [Lacticaseibacillus daqingensis]